jgi:hypothetical protein
MSNPMKYIRDLEAAGFQRTQAEAQVQMVLDVLEGDLVTKSDFNTYKEHIDGRFAEVDHRFDRLESKMDYRFRELELRMTIKLGAINLATASVTIALLTWLIRIH